MIMGRLWRALTRSLLMMMLVLCWSVTVHSDEMRPGLLDIKERNNGWFDVTWKVPAREGKTLPLYPKLPAHLKLIGSPTYQTAPMTVIEQSTYAGDGTTLAGHTISIDGLKQGRTDILLRIELKDGSVHSTILSPTAPEFLIPERASKGEVIAAYWQMGTIHILEGIDHLLFVFAMLLIVSGLGPLIKAITSFTVAHSITLVLATLGMLSLPAAPTEAIISLSIVFLAAEIIRKRQGEQCLTERYPWLIAFAFGLFHGLGFAGALSEIGVPEHEVPLALLMFNVGVETGQLLFIAVVLSLFAVLKKLPITPPKSAWRVLPYSIGSIAAFWTIERVVSFIPLS